MPATIIFEHLRMAFIKLQIQRKASPFFKLDTAKSSSKKPQHKKHLSLSLQDNYGNICINAELIQLLANESNNFLEKNCRRRLNRSLGDCLVNLLWLMNPSVLVVPF
jgi:hypothetical protein